MNQNEFDTEHFQILGIGLGIGHEWGGIRVPPDLSLRAQKKLHTIVAENGAAYYVSNRVCDYVAGIFLQLHLGDSIQGRLATLDEDLCNGTDYVIWQNGQSISIDFTQGKVGLSKKQSKGEHHAIIQVNGSMLHGYVREISHQMRNPKNQGLSADEIIKDIFQRNKITIGARFFESMKGLSK